MSNIVQRLRDNKWAASAWMRSVFAEAADEIARLNTEVVLHRAVASFGSVADGKSDRPKPINAARLAALEQLSALDQALELEYGLTGNPMIKGQERTPQTQLTPGEGSEPREGT